jgi:ribose/xylose/arabinose/galactoside ABC-type transport system permease subunit
MLGKALVTLGILFVAIGLALLYAPWLVNWFGRLPGDLSFTRGGTRVFVPVTSMLIVSIVLTIVLNLFFRR